MKKSKYTVSKTSVPISCVIGIIISVLILVIISLFMSFFVNKEYIGLNSIRYIAWLVVFISCFIGCFMAGKIVDTNKATTCSIVAAGNLIIQLAVAILLFDGLYNGIFISALPVLAGGGCAILLVIKPKTLSRSKKRRAYR